MPTACAESALFHQNVGLAYHMARRLARSRADVRRLGDDAEQLALIALWSACQTFDPAKGFTFASYACRAIIRRVLRAAARGRRQPSCFSEIEADQANPVDPPAPERDSPDPLEAERVRRAVAVLAEKNAADAVVIRRRYLDLDGPSLAQVGAELGVTHERAAQRERRALSRLREALA